MVFFTDVEFICEAITSLKQSDPINTKTFSLFYSHELFFIS